MSRLCRETRFIHEFSGQLLRLVFRWWQKKSGIYSWGDNKFIEGVAFCETVQGEKRILILSSDGAFVFLHTSAELPNGLAHVRAGTFRVWYLVPATPSTGTELPSWERERLNTNASLWKCKAVL